MLLFTAAHSDDYSDEITPLTKHISQHGNTTVYQLRHGVAPDKIVKADDAAAGKPGERDENVAEDEVTLKEEHFSQIWENREAFITDLILFIAFSQTMLFKYFGLISHLV